jgi:hypothetical protein
MYIVDVSGNNTSWPFSFRPCLSLYINLCTVTEVLHDARVIRLDIEHMSCCSQGLRSWLSNL